MNKQEFVKAIQQDLQVVRIKTGVDVGSALINKQDVLDMVYKLDESEITEEQAWEVIKNKNHYHLAPAYVEEYQCLINAGIKPEKTEELVIPQFVADYIDDVLSPSIDDPIFRACIEMIDDEKVERNIEFFEWLQDNAELYYKACLNPSGYTVEKEQLYTVIIPSTDILWRYRYLSVKGGIGVTDSYKEIERVTERLIRSVDDRLMIFAEKVEDE